MGIWQSRIRDLRKIGYSLADIAEAVGLSRSAVNNLAAGRSVSPRGNAAIELHALHGRACVKRSRKSA
jgi:transcriptional regulator with XRE-family HTH domain